MAGVLELAQLAQDDDVAEVDVGRRRVDPQLYAQRPPGRELLGEPALGEGLLGVGQEHVDVGHGGDARELRGQTP